MAGVAVLVVLAALVAAEVDGWGFLRGPVQRAASRAAGVPVTLTGGFSLHLLRPPALEVEHLVVGAAQGVPVGHLLMADGLTLRWRWADLWRWHQGAPLRLRSLDATSLDASLMRTADGHASWQLGTDQPDTGPATRPSLDRLRVDQGLIRWIDVQTDTRAVVTLQVANGSALAFAAVGTVRALSVDVKGRADGTLALLQDDSAGPAAAPIHVQAAGKVGRSKLSFDGSADSLFRAQQVDGELRFSGPSLAAVGDPLGISLPRTPAFDLQGRLGHQAGRWTLLARRFAVGRSLLSGDFVYDSTRSPPLLSGRLEGQRLMLADLGPAVGAAGEGVSAAGAGTPAVPPGTASTARPGRVLPDRLFDLPSLRAMRAEVAVAIAELDFGTPAMAPFQDLRTQLSLNDGVLRLTALQATVAAGQVRGATQLDARGQTALWSADLQLAKLDLAGWLRGVQAPGKAASAAPATRPEALRRARERARLGGAQPVQAYLTGLLDADLHLRGSGRSTAQILGSLDGSADATLSQGSVSHLLMEAAGLDLAQGLGVLVSGDGPLPLRCARADLAFKDGVATWRRGVIDNKDSLILVVGQVNLRDETLDMKAIVRPHDFSPLSLRTPLLLTGTLAHPQVGIEGGRLAGRVAAAFALGAVAGPAALLAFLDPGTEPRGDPCTAGIATAPLAASAPRAAPGATRR